LKGHPGNLWIIIYLSRAACKKQPAMHEAYKMKTKILVIGLIKPNPLVIKTIIEFLKTHMS